MVGDNFVLPAMYANTPMSEDVASDIWNSSHKRMRPVDIVNKLLNLCDSFEYEYDDKAVGMTGFSFAEESLISRYYDQRTGHPFLPVWYAIY